MYRYLVDESSRSIDKWLNEGITAEWGHFARDSGRAIVIPDKNWASNFFKWLLDKSARSMVSAASTSMHLSFCRDGKRYTVRYHRLTINYMFLFRAKLFRSFGKQNSDALTVQAEML